MQKKHVYCSTAYIARSVRSIWTTIKSIRVFKSVQTLCFSKLTYRNLSLLRKRGKKCAFTLQGPGYHHLNPAFKEHHQQQDYLTFVPPDQTASPGKNSCQKNTQLNLRKLWDLTSSLREMQGIKE